MSVSCQNQTKLHFPLSFTVLFLLFYSGKSVLEFVQRLIYAGQVGERTQAQK